MSKRIARNPESYEAEARQFTDAAKLLESVGFQKVKARKEGSVKIIDAESADGGHVSFWVKLGWVKTIKAAIQFGMFAGPEGKNKTDAEFVTFVNDRVKNMKKRGVTHVLLIHGATLQIALPVDMLAAAYAEQMKKFPKIARNTKSPTMFFFDPRPNANLELTAIVLRRAIPLDVLAGRSTAKPQDVQSRSRMAEVELRVLQAVFRSRVGERCGWRCVVTGSRIKETLDAAHLPGKNWRKHNQATDGVMLRVDVHRLIDGKLARIQNGKLRLSKAAMTEYAQYEGCVVV
jgi:hypothetical protein